MFKRIISLIGLFLLLVKSVTGVQEVVVERSALSPLFYILVLFIVVVLGFVIFFIKKLNYNRGQILRSIWISLLISIGIEILFAIVASILGVLGVFIIFCKAGAPCPGPFIETLGFTPYTLPIIFLVVLLIYYIVKFIKSK